jgi:hypothetical protein
MTDQTRRPTDAERREARLAAQLRANLRRRKGPVPPAAGAERVGPDAADDEPT